MRRVAVIAAVLVAGGASACTCSKGGAPASGDGGAATAQEDAAANEGTGLSAPIAAARVPSGEVIVAGLDVPSKSIVVQRLGANDAVVAERKILEGVTWSSEAELKVAPAKNGAAVTWRGLRKGELVRQNVVLGPDLAPSAGPVAVAAASCATQDGIWFSDGVRVDAKPWSGAASSAPLPKHEDAALVCGAHRAFVLLDEEDGTSVVVLGAGASTAPAAATSLLKDADFADDEQRERAEYTVGDDLGVVRLATSGALAIREMRGGSPGPLRKLTTKIPHDDDVVAVDASAGALVIVYTQDVSESCAKTASKAGPSTRVMALRVDRATFDESIVEVSPGLCGRVVGPFFTGTVGNDVSVAWVERAADVKKARAPIVGLAHRVVGGAAGAAKADDAAVARIDVAADALVDAGCDAAHCYAVALVRKPGADGMVPGFARVLKY